MKERRRKRNFFPPYEVFVTYVSFPNFPFSWMHFGSGGQKGNETVQVETEMTSFKLNYTRFCRFSTFFGLIRRIRYGTDEMERNLLNTGRNPCTFSCRSSEGCLGSTR